MFQFVQGELSKDIIKGAGFTVLIFAASIYLPLIGFFFSLLIPLPILFYRIKLGRNNGAIAPAVAIVSMIVLLGGVSIDILFFAGLILVGFALGEFIEMNLSVEKTILYSSSAVLLLGTIGLIFYSNISDRGLVTVISEYVAKSLQLTVALYENMGMPEEKISLISGSLKDIEYVLVRIIPALIVVLTLFLSWITLLLARLICKNTNLFFPDFGSLNHWKAPEQLVWCVIVCGLMLLLPSKGLKVLGLNGLIVLIIAYFFQGIAIVSFYFEKKHFPRMLKFFMYSIIAFQQILLLFVIGLGFFDMWMDFRKLEVKESE